MINYEDLEKVWETLIYSGKAEFEFYSFDNGRSEIPIFIGLNSKKNRCLFLELPVDISVDFINSEKENLSLYYFEDTKYIVLELTDDSYFDLFNDLVISIYQRIYNFKDTQKAINTFVKMFYKWSEFFDDKNSNKLSDESIKGLWGEMYVLKDLIENTESKYLNDILRAWKGPYDKGHDFELENKSIEVKTKDVTKQNIIISSEYQLEIENGKDLELLVLSVDKNYIKGKSLSDLFNLIKESVISKLGDFTIVLDALLQKNITQKNIYEYDNFRFKEIEEIVFGCTENFPCLNKSNTDQSIHSVRYSLNLNSLTNFIINKRSFNDRD